MFRNQSFVVLFWIILSLVIVTSAKAENSKSNGKSTNSGSYTPSSSYAGYKTKSSYAYSTYGYNSGSYSNFTFNKVFNITKVYRDGTESIPYYYVWLIRYLTKKAESGDMPPKLKPQWEPIAVGLYDSYKYERGAVIYDEVVQLWRYCGWVIVPSSFYPIWDPIKVCASPPSFGLTAVQRDPIPLVDYIPKHAIKDLREKALQQLKKPKFGRIERHSENTSGRANEDTRGAVRIDLFQLTTDVYADKCKELTASNLSQKTMKAISNVSFLSYSFASVSGKGIKKLNRDPTWKAACCYSAYIGSPFCSQQPYSVV